MKDMVQAMSALRSPVRIITLQSTPISHPVKILKRIRGIALARNKISTIIERCAEA